MSSEKEFLRHLSAGRDPVYFAEKIMGVRLNPAQQRWFELTRQNPDGWSWKYRRVVHVAANQIGKTLGLAILILWAANYKIGIRHDNWDYLLSSPYKWFHLAPTYGQALLTHKDMKALIEGTHPAQYNRETGEKHKVRWAPGLATEVKFDQQYVGYRLWNGSEIHFRTSDEKAKALQGVRAHGISFDEAAFEPYLHEVLDQAVKLRLVSTGGPLWLVSTPDGINDYYEIVEQIRQAGHQTFHDRVWEAPLKRWALVWSHITDNVGYGLTQDDVDFMEEDVDPATKEQQLRGAFLEPQDAFFVPAQEILRSWVKGIPETDRPRNGHKYVIFWDPSVSGSGDPTVVTVIDVTRKPWRGVFFKRWEKPMGIRTLIPEMRRLHAEWNSAEMGRAGWGPRAITAFDATSMGGTIIRQELAEISPSRGLNFAGKVKMNSLTNLRAALSRHDILLPQAWTRTQREILNYRLDDAKLQQDAVMSLAGAAQIAAQGFGGARSRPFDPGARVASWRRR